MNQELMTQDGYDALISELKDLKTVQRPQIVKEIDIARSYGDLKENAEYHAAKEKQSIIDSRIATLSSLLAVSKIIDLNNITNEKACFGSKVCILNLDTEKKITYTIMGSYESDPDNNIIYYNTPIAKALLNKQKGDEVEISLPNGISEFEILSIEV